MDISKNSLILAAAFTGLLSGTTARAAEPASQDKGSQSTAKSAKKSTAKVEKHSCAGKNSCKGNGGCSGGDNGCKGKNSCKGKGGCATDGK